MAAPTLTQNPTRIVTGDNTSEQLSGTVGSWDQSVGAGSTLIAFIHQTNAESGRTFTVSDSVDGSWTALTRYDRDNRQAQIFYIEDHTGGTVNVTVTSNSAAVKEVQLAEISASTFDVESGTSQPGTSVDPTNGYYTSADGTVIDTAADVFVVAGVTTDATASFAAGTNYTILSATNIRICTQYRTSASALTDERGWVTNNGSDRDWCAAIASFATAASGNTVAPGAGSATLTGQVPTVNTSGPAQDIEASPGVGALGLTGYAPALSTPTSTSYLPATAHIAFSGYAPTVVAGDNRYSYPVAGSLELMTTAPIVSVTVDSGILNYSPPVGSLAFTGQVPVVTGGSSQEVIDRQPPVGSFIFTGQAPTVLLDGPVASYEITIPEGGVTFTGQLPTVAVEIPTSHEISVPEGSLSFMQLAPIITGGINPNPPTSKFQTLRRMRKRI